MGEIPREYLEFVAAYPELPEGLADVREHEIVDNLDRVVRLNQQVREQPPLGGTPWPDRYFVIGDSGCGDWYCLDTLGVPKPVVWWNHEVAMFEPVAESLPSFFQQILREP